MKAHTSEFKEQIKTLGRELDSIISFNGTELSVEELNSVTPHYEGGLLKSVMKQLDIDSNVEINVGDVVNYKLGIKVNDEYEYLNFGNYIVNKVEKQEDFNSYMITCYDKMLYSMKDYEKLNINYPISIRDYITAICNHLGINFKNKNETFANYDKMIQNELYLDENDNSLGYTFRDVFDELAQATASTICINDNDELEIRYINDTQDTIDEEFLRDINVNFGEKYGPINSIVLSRSASSDNVYLRDEASVSENGLTELKISDNQIMNWNDRSDYLPDILEKINGLEYYLNDFVSTGICYYDLCDKYNVKIGDNIYPCIMLNDEINITQGLFEEVFTEELEISETDYTKSDKTDRKINQTYLIVDKQNSVIQGVVEKTEQIEQDITTTKQASGNSIIVEDAGPYSLESIEIEGKSVQDGTPTPDAPVEIETVKGVRNLFDKSNWSNINYGATGNTVINKGNVTSDFIKVNSNKKYTQSTSSKVGYLIATLFNSSKTFIKRIQLTNTNINSFETTSDTSYVRVGFSLNATTIMTQEILDSMNPMLEEGSIAHKYVPYGSWLEQKTTGKNLLNIYDILSQSTDTYEVLEDDWIHYANTTGSTKYIYFADIKAKPNTKYYYRYELQENLGKDTTFFLEFDKDKNKVSTLYPSGSRFVTTTAKTEYIRIGITTSGQNTKDDFKIRLMLVESEVVDTIYEPYKENTALIDMNKINLFDKDNIILGYNLESSTGGSYLATDRSYFDYIEIRPNTAYTIGGITIKTICYYNETKTFIGAVSSTNIITTPVNSKYVRVSFDNTKDYNNPILFEGYSPYYELVSIENVKDTFKNGVLTQNIGKYILDSNSNITTRNTGNGSTTYAFNFNDLFYKIKNYGASNIKTTHFIYNQSSADGIEGVSIDGSAAQVFVEMNRSHLADVSTGALAVSSFKTWLQEQYDAGTPVIIYYVLATPIEHTLNYDKLELHKGYNYITLNDELEPNMNIEYLVDSKLNSQYATKSELKITNDEIRTEVSKKVGENEVASVISQTADKIFIESNNFGWKSENSEMTIDGAIITKKGKIGGFNIEENNLSIDLTTKYTYTQDDITKVTNYLLNSGTLTEEEIKKYDLSGDGQIKSNDLAIMQRLINYNITSTTPGKLIIERNEDIPLLSKIAVLGGNSKEITKIDFSGISTNNLNVEDKNILSNIFFSKNDVFNVYRTTPCAGYLTGGSKNIEFSLILPKMMADEITGATIDSFNFAIRNADGGYIMNGTEFDGTINVFKATDNILLVQMLGNTAFNFTNNTPVTVSVNAIDLTFN